MPSTRSRLRSSQSQSISLVPVHAEVPIKQGGDETFESLSTAVLPLGYTIKLATTSDVELSDEKKEEEYVRGQEFLSDGVRRVRDKEWNLGDLVKARQRKRRRVDRDDGSGERSAGLDKDVLWYTASLRHSCSCDLEFLPQAFTPRRPPPASADLSPISNCTDSSEVVRLGDDIAEWHKPEEGYIDLEPELDNLQEFEPDWRNLTGSLWESHVSGRFCDALDHDEEDSEEEMPHRSIVQETPAVRWLRKGKFRATDHASRTVALDFAPDTPIQVHDVVLETPYPPAKVPDKDVVTNEEISQERIDWEEEAKRRKKLWRGLIGKDPGYGQFWESLSRPHSYANIGALRDRSRPSDYNLPRNYHIAPHPFHPDIHHYARARPYGRVYWLIPIHGPVVIPELNDDVLTSPIATKETTIPLPSSATYTSKAIAGSKNRSAKPATLHWNGALLNHLIQAFLLPLRRSRNYGMSIMFSGPKPDPFIDLKPPDQLKEHAHVVASLPEPKEAEGLDVPVVKALNGDSIKSRPIRVEAGDHMRIYCDAKHALSLRTWLHGVHIDGKAINQPGGIGSGAKWRLFDKVRLCLIGERGEVLIVA